MKILRNPGGSKRREVELSEVQVPDLWYLAAFLADMAKHGDERFAHASNDVLEIWYLAHDLLWNLRLLEVPIKKGITLDSDPLSGPEGD